MPDDSNILGTQVQIGGAEAAMDALAARQQAHADAFALGMTGTAYTPANSEVAFQYAVVPGASLITSQGLDARPNPAYDQALQGRDRERAASLSQIQSIAASLNPERLGQSALASEGAPIIGPDMQVESGNGRSLAILTAYEQNLPSARGYQDYLTQNAGQFGLDPAQIAATANPVLVRVRQTEMDAQARARFASEANFSSVAQMSDVERAQRDAQSLLRSPILGQFTPSEGAGINPVVNRDFLRGFAEFLPPSELGGFLQGDGQVSQAGLKQAQNALLAAAYPGADLSRMLESTDDNARNIGAAMLNSAGRFAQVRAAADAGNLHDLSIGADVGQASGILSSLRESGQTVSKFLTQAGQPDLFGDRFLDSLSPLVPDLLQAMDAHKRSPKKLAEIFNAYAGGVEAIGNPQQGALFGGAVPSRQELFRAARGYVEKHDGQTGLPAPEFGEDIREAYTPPPGSRALPNGNAGSAAEVGGIAAPVSSLAEVPRIEAVANDFAPSGPALPPGPPPSLPALGGSDEPEEEPEPKPETFLPRIGRPSRMGFRRPSELTREQAEADVLRGYDAPALNALTMQKGMPGYSARAAKDANARFESDVQARLDAARQEQQAAALGDDAALAVPQNDGETWTGANYERPGRALIHVPRREEIADGEYSRGFGVSQNAQTDMILHPELANARRSVPALISELVSSTPALLSALPALIDDPGSADGFADGFADTDEAAGVGLDGLGFAEEAAQNAGMDPEDALFGGMGRGRRRSFAGRLRLGRQNLRSAFSGSRALHAMAFGVGYSLLSLGQGAGRYASEMGDGTYHTPEQQAAAGAEDFAPGVGGLVGTVGGEVVGGMLGGPVGAMVGGLAGQFAGQAVGQAGAAIYGAAEERAQAARELNEALQAATGSVRDFSGAIANGAAAVKDDKAAVGKIGTVGTFGDNTFAGTDRLTAAFHENAEANWSAIAKYAGNPLTPGMGRTFAGGKEKYGDIASLAYDAAENGDFGGLKQLQQSATEAASLSDPYYRDKDFVERQQKMSWGASIWQSIWTPSKDDAYFEAKVRLNHEKPAANIAADVAAQNSLVNDVADAQALSLSAQARLKRTQAEGGAATDIGDAAILGRQADEQAISGLSRDLANPLNAGRKTEIQAKIDGLRAEQSGLAAAGMEADMEEHGAQFSLAQTRARLEGRSAGVIGAEMRAQADYLRNVNGPLSPAKRAGLDEQALTLDYGAKLGEYDETLARNDLHRTQAGAGVARAAATGGPQQVFDAQQSVLGTFADRIKELTAELAAGGLAVTDRIAKEKELAQVQGEAATLAHDAQQALFARRRGLAQDSLGALTDGLSRAVAIGGNAAVTPQMVGEAQHSVDIDTDALRKARTPEDKARWTRQRVDDTLTRDQLAQEQQTYHPDAETLTVDAAVAGGLTRAERRGGQARQEAARLALSRDEDKLAALAQTDALATDPLAHLANARTREALLNDEAERRTEAQTWTMSVSERAGDITATGAFRRAQLTPYADGTPGSDPLTAGNALIGEKQKLLAEAQAALNKTDKNDPAFAANTQAVDALKTDIAQVLHERETALLNAVPEILAGAPSPGISAGILPPAALAARYAPGPLVGSWGRAAAGWGLGGDHAPEDPFIRAVHQAGHSTPPGHPAATPATPPAGQSGAADTTNKLLGDAVRVLQQIAAGVGVGHGGSASRPAHDVVGPMNYALGHGLNV